MVDEYKYLCFYLGYSGVLFSLGLSSIDFMFSAFRVRSYRLISGEIYFVYGQELTGCLDAPVVFAHNDLLSGNLMLNDEEGMYDHSLECLRYASYLGTAQ